MKDMKVTILSLVDYAGSGYKLCEALKKVIDVDLFTGPNSNAFNHPIRNIITEYNTHLVQQRIDDSDIIHLKGDWPPLIYEQHFKLRIKHKPIVVTVSGSLFRLRHHGGLGIYPFELYDCHRTSFEPDLCYEGFTDVWMPHPIDSIDKPNSWTQGNILSHSPTQRRKKNSDFILRVFDKLPECDIRLIEGIDHREAIKQRRESTIFFDQFLVGFYGNAAIEAMQYGIPTAAFLSPDAISQAKGGLRDCPIINEPLNVLKWAEMIKRLLDSDMTELSKRTKEYCDRVHSYESVAEKWINYYKAL